MRRQGTAGAGCGVATGPPVPRSDAADVSAPGSGVPRVGPMRIGILGGTGPAGRGLAVRLAAAGDDVVLGSRDAGRAAAVAAGLVEAWPDRALAISGASNEDCAAADLVVVATPWDGAVATVRPLAGTLAGKVVVSMANALVKEGREFLALIPPRGRWPPRSRPSCPGRWCPQSFHHLPASEMEKLDESDGGRRPGVLGPP